MRGRMVLVSKSSGTGVFLQKSGTRHKVTKRAGVTECTVNGEVFRVGDTVRVFNQQSYNWFHRRAVIVRIVRKPGRGFRPASCVVRFPKTGCLPESEVLVPAAHCVLLVPGHKVTL